MITTATTCMMPLRARDSRRTPAQARTPNLSLQLTHVFTILVLYRAAATRPYPGRHNLCTSLITSIYP